METKQSNNSATPMADAVKIANQRALFSLEWENDTVFKKRELNYKTKAAFQKDLEAGKISKYTTVFIKDSKQIYKNGQYYGLDYTDNVAERLFMYGIEFDVTVSSPECKRIGNMDLHRELPIHNEMRGCLLSDDGIVTKYLNPNNWTNETLDGSQGQVMVELPEYYRKFETDGNKRRVKLSKMPLPGYTLVKKKYVSAYHATLQHSTNKLCSVVNTDADYRGGNNQEDWDNTYRSMLGMPLTFKNRTEFRTYARNRKEGSFEWNIMTYDIQKDLFWLYVIEYATLNSQKEYNPELSEEGYKQGGLGNGVTNMNNWNEYNGSNPIVSCGYTNEIGNGTGEKILESIDWQYQTTGWLLMKNYTFDTAVCEVTKGTSEVTITNIKDSGRRFSYVTAYNQSGSVTYNITGLAEGQTIDFISGNVIATASSDGDITVNWGTEIRNRELKANFTGACNIVITIIDAEKPLLNIKRNEMCVPRYRGIENPFGHIWTYEDGISSRISANSPNGDGMSKVFITENPEYFNDDNYDNMTYIGNEARNGGYIKSIIFGEYGDIIPDVVGGSSTTYLCDYHHTNIPSNGEQLRRVLFGGAYYEAFAGFGSAASNDSPSVRTTHVGSRLCFIPKY